MDPKLFKETYDRYGPLVWFVIGKVGVAGRDREDVFMESWEAVFTSWASFSGRSSLATWIGSIARNKAVDRVRSFVPIPLEDTEILQREESTWLGPELGPGRDAIRREAGELLEKFMRGLPRRRRSILEQWLEGLTYREIAARVGRKGDTNYVGREIYLAKAQLAEMMASARISSLEDIWE